MEWAPLVNGGEIMYRRGGMVQAPGSRRPVLSDRNQPGPERRSSGAGPVSPDSRHRIAGRQENTSRLTDAVFKSGFSEYLGLLSCLTSAPMGQAEVFS